LFGGTPESMVPSIADAPSSAASPEPCVLSGKAVASAASKSL
jgi:hypothetical protein